MDIEAISPTLRRAIEIEMSERQGVGMRITSIERRDVLSSSSDRTFHLLKLSYGESGRAELHVRLTPWKAHHLTAHDLDAYLAARPYPVPMYFGSVRDQENVAALWEYCHGRTFRSFIKATPAQIEAVVRAIALISATATDVAEQVHVPVRQRWVHPVAQDILALNGAMKGLKRLRARLETFAAHEEALLERLQGQELQVLNHNDLVSKNTVLMDDGTVRLLDWDSATIGPPGASIRDFSKQEAADEVAALYAGELRRHGVPAKDDEVRFVMRAQQVFWNLSSGLRLRHGIRIRNGLRLFDVLLESDQAFRPAKEKPMQETASSPRHPLPAPDSLKALVQQCMDEKGKQRLYSMIPHPDFEHIPAGRGAERFEMIRPHLSPDGGTALDLGAHFATFSHWLEDAGYKVTAVEHSPLYAEVARQVRDLSGKTFEVIEGSIFDLPDLRYDVVLALNIFHHFLKTQRRYEAFVALLDRLHCDVMFFESHRESEDQMKDAHVNMAPEAFARFIAERTGLTEITVIGEDKKRTVFKLARPR